jgi:hypothetical protein
MTTTEAPVRRPTFTDIALVVLANGVSGVGKMHPEPSRRSLIRAAEDLTARGKGDLAQKLLDTYVGQTTKGKPPPVDGLVRIYKVQATPAGLDFGRIPTAVLGVSKGGNIQVTFHKKRIIIEAAGPDAEAGAETTL